MKRDRVGKWVRVRLLERGTPEWWTHLGGIVARAELKLIGKKRRQAAGHGSSRGQKRRAWKWKWVWTKIQGVTSPLIWPLTDAGTRGRGTRRAVGVLSGPCGN